MPNVNAVLAAEINRLSKRVVNASTKVTRKLVIQHRHDLAKLKQQIATLTKRLALVEKTHPKEVPVPPEIVDKARFRAMGVKAHRAKLRLSGKDYGKLVGVSDLTIYSWESGKSTPRDAQKAMWLAIRGLGKREALQRLGMAQPEKAAATPAVIQNAHGDAGGIKAHRTKLGLSYGEYAKLVGVSPKSIYRWETGKRTPMPAQKAQWLAIRNLGKPEALKRLGMTETKAAPVAKPAPQAVKKSGPYKQTAEGMILSLLKGRKAMTTSQLVAEWKKSGRGGAVDNTLSMMTKAGKLKRTPLGGKMGSQYRTS